MFNVACNDKMLLEHFGILAVGGSAPVIKTFDNIQASAGGRIELSFMPVVNYAVVNAIEVLPEKKNTDSIVLLLCCSSNSIAMTESGP